MSDIIPGCRERTNFISCIYVNKPGGPKPPLGDYLGEWTNELSPKHGVDSYITRFACGGPKNYSYVVNNGKKHCKVRGFTLNFKNSQILNFDSMRNAICKFVEKPSNIVGLCKRQKKEDSLDIVNDCKITREKWTRHLVNKEVKSYQIVYDKWIILNKGQDTIPFGYHWSPPTGPVVSSQIVRTVPDHILFTLVQPSVPGARGEQLIEVDTDCY